jgi:2-dehydro-3-deoxy-D-gluconate 5-dehydrogenase
MCSQAAYPEMKKVGRGKIINVASGMAVLAGPLSTPYAAYKAAMVQMGRAMATAWGKDNIQVNAVLPGWTNTDMTARRHTMADFNERVIACTPLGRWGEPDDFAGIAVFLASQASDFVTAGAFVVDGGYTVTV